MNDWFDRHVDAINEPNRPIPSGRMPGRLGLYIAIGWTVLSLLRRRLARALGLRRHGAGGWRSAWAYSRAAAAAEAERLVGQYRLRRLLRGPALDHRRRGDGGRRAGSGAWCWSPVLYSLGAHGIMTLNDFKSIEGDRAHGHAAPCPSCSGAERAAQVACVVMAVPQVAVVALLLAWGAPWHAAAIAVLLAGAAGLLMRKLLRDPRGLAPWYNGTGDDAVRRRHAGHRLRAARRRHGACLACPSAGSASCGWAWCRPRWARWSC